MSGEVHTVKLDTLDPEIVVSARVLESASSDDSARCSSSHAFVSLDIGGKRIGVDIKAKAKSDLTPTPEEDTSKVGIDPSQVNFEYFSIDKQKIQKYHTKVRRALEDYWELPVDRKKQTFNKAQELFEKTRNWFQGQAVSYSLKDEQAIKEFKAIPCKIQKFLNRMQKLEGKPIYYPDDESRIDGEIPYNAVVVFRSSMYLPDGKLIEENLPLAAGNHSLRDWETGDELCKNPIKDHPNIRMPEFEEVLALCQVPKRYGLP
jgi:hypothetical protein